jgi:hypothetical protein
MKSLLLGIITFWALAPSVAGGPTDATQAAIGDTTSRPKELRFGAPVSEMEAKLAKRCEAVVVRRIDPPFLPRVHDRQMQLDCEGFRYAGRPRHAESLFGDDRLEMAWIIVTHPEESAVLRALSSVYGVRQQPNAIYSTFPTGSVAYRHDRSEVLFFDPRLAADHSGKFTPAPQSSANGSGGHVVTAGDWRSDIGELVSHVRVTHPEPFDRVGEQTFLRAAEVLKDELPLLTDEQRTVRAMKLVAMIGDGHTILTPTTEAYGAWYPVHIAEFTDGYFVTSAHKSVPDLVGARVLEFGHKPIAEAANAARDLLGSDNRFLRKEMLHAIHNAGLMRGLGLAEDDGSVVVKLMLRNGKTVERTLRPQRGKGPFTPDQASLDWRFGRTEVTGVSTSPSSEWISAYRDLPANAYFTYDSSRPPHLSQRSLFTRSMPEQNAFYIMINIWQATSKESVPSFFRRAMEEVERLRPKRLILDLRYNPGGDGADALPVIQELVARKNHQPWEDLYILVSGRTYSASLNFLGQLQANVPATLIGEPMGGSYHLDGDYSTFTLPKTGLELRVSALRHELTRSDDLREIVPVDVPAPFSFADYAAGRDPAVDPILRGEEMRSIRIVALRDGGAAARRVYLDRKARYAGLDVWAPPTELELRTVGKELLDAKRTADAIETFKLNTQVNPLEWRSWYNLAEAQRGAGMIRDAIASYRRCLALNDPTNFHAGSLAGLIGQLEKQVPLS